MARWMMMKRLLLSTSKSCMAGTNWHYKVIDKKWHSSGKLFEFEKQSICFDKNRGDRSRVAIFCVDRTSSLTNLHDCFGERKKGKIRAKVLVLESREKKERKNKRGGERRREKETHHSVYAIKKILCQGRNIEECVWFWCRWLILAM